MGGASAPAGASFSDADMLGMQQDMVNAAIRAEAQAKDRTLISNVGAMPGLTSLDSLAADYLANLQKLPPTPQVKSMIGKLGKLSDVPPVSKVTTTAKAPGVTAAGKAPKVIDSPTIATPSDMPFRSAESLLTAKKAATTSASQRQGRASTILSNKDY